MATPRYPTTIDNLPGEVLSEIFVRLLAKEVGQMRCVSKCWNALLSDSSFVKSHLHHSIQNNDEILLVLDHIFYSDRATFTARSSRSPDLELTNFIIPPLHLESKVEGGFVIGSVNGLICFCYTSLVDNYVLYIWNPSLSAVLTLPPSSFPSTRVLFVLGFGYDPKTDDYKVVKLTTISRAHNMVPQGEVYSMRKGFWKLISLQTFPSHITRLPWQNQVCVDGHLHWLGYSGYERKLETIVAFDLGAETFSEIPLPDFLLHNHGSRIYCLGVLGGKLCVMSRVVRDGGNWEVWVMDEYGVSDSWVKRHVFSQLSGHITPYGFTSHGEFLFQVDGDIDHFPLYDPIAATTKVFKITGGPCPISEKVIEYVDSLVWIAPANGI